MFNDLPKPPKVRVFVAKLKTRNGDSSVEVDGKPLRCTGFDVRARAGDFPEVTLHTFQQDLDLELENPHVTVIQHTGAAPIVDALVERIDGLAGVSDGALLTVEFREQGSTYKVIGRDVLTLLDPASEEHQKLTEALGRLDARWSRYVEKVQDA